MGPWNYTFDQLKNSSNLGYNYSVGPGIVGYRGLPWKIELVNAGSDYKYISYKGDYPYLYPTPWPIFLEPFTSSYPNPNTIVSNGNYDFDDVLRVGDVIGLLQYYPYPDSPYAILAQPGDNQWVDLVAGRTLANRTAWIVEASGTPNRTALKIGQTI